MHIKYSLLSKLQIQFSIFFDFFWNFKKKPTQNRHYSIFSGKTSFYQLHTANAVFLQPGTPIQRAERFFLILMYNKKTILQIFNIRNLQYLIIRVYYTPCLFRLSYRQHSTARDQPLSKWTPTAKPEADHLERVQSTEGKEESGFCCRLISQKMENSLWKWERR